MSFLLWSGRAVGWRRALVGLGLAVVCFGGSSVVTPSDGFGSPRALLLTVALFLAGLAVTTWSAAMAHVGVRISAYSVRVRHGLLPVPPLSVPLRMVRGVTVTEVRSSIGQRWGWTWLPGRGSAVIVRSGPALVFDLGSGRRLTVSVDEPEEAMAALARLRVPAR